MLDARRKIKKFNIGRIILSDKINIYDTPQELAESFAGEFKKICDEVISKTGKINIALSGGNTPKILFEILAVDYKSKIDWAKVNLFWVDERCVPPDDEESNYGMTKKYLLNKINIPSINVHRIFGEKPPEEEAKRYSVIVKLNLVSKNGLPEFDMILLGVGEDGHTASIFPDQMELLNSNEIYAAGKNPVSGQARITLTGRVINNADRIYFLVAGKSKAEVVEKILNKSGDYLKYPAAHIENAVWFIG